MTDQHLLIGVVGATGVVGQEALSILESRGHPVEHIRCYGSNRSVGKCVSYNETDVPLLHTDQIADHELDFALLCADAQTARDIRTKLSSTTTVIIDNSSAFRMDADVPLVIPEVNGHLLRENHQVIANPNCSTIMMLAALQPIREAYGIKSISVTTYQAVSGAGKAGITELYDQTRAHMDGRDETPLIFPTSCAFNVFEHESEIDPKTGFNGEETKMILETKRIWDDKDIAVLPTCVRVPVERAHAQAITIDINTPVSAEDIKATLKSPALRVFDVGDSITPRDAAGHDDIFVGRIRFDPSSNGTRVLLWICCDQVRKGAALNAIQIMDTIISVRMKNSRT